MSVLSFIYRLCQLLMQINFFENDTEDFLNTILDILEINQILIQINIVS